MREHRVTFGSTDDERIKAYAKEHGYGAVSDAIRALALEGLDASVRADNQSRDTQELIAARSLCAYVLGRLNAIARDESDPMFLEWFTSNRRGLSHDQMVCDCLENPEQERWDRGLEWLTLAGSNKANRLFMTSIAQVCGRSKSHANHKLLCAADGDTGYSLTTGNRATLSEILDGELPENWYGVKVTRPPSQSDSVAFLYRMKADAPGQIKRLKSNIRKAIDAGTARGMARREIERRMIHEWDTGRQYGGLLTPLIRQVFRDAQEVERPVLRLVVGGE